MKRVSLELYRLGLVKCSSVNYKLNVSPSKPQLLLGIQKCAYFNQKQSNNYSTKPELASSLTESSSKSVKETTPEDSKNKDELIETPSTSTETQLQETVVELTPEMQAREQYYRQKKIMKLHHNDPSLIDTSVGVIGRPVRSLLEHREGAYGRSGLTGFLAPESKTMTDQLAFIQQDIDLRPESIKRWWRNKKEKKEIQLQLFSSARHNVLGSDLAAVHFVTFRGGKVKLMGYEPWVDHYRTVQDEEDEIVLPKGLDPDKMLILPAKYDPNFLVTAVDCSNMTFLRYEGLLNLSNLNYCTYLKFQNCIHIDAWCIDRLASMFENHLEFLDLSGCTALTEGALCAIARFRKLKTLVLKDIPHITNKDVACAWLEDMNPNLTIIGTDYQQKLYDIKQENERLNKRSLEEEARTITIEPGPHGPGPDPVVNEDIDSADLAKNATNK